ncbi:tRNA (guanine(37)-N1)-methyltransferase [Astathelohania contejeani]|uniref:tRNA (guanine(37)-N1)-methyltransferase n=1 Tax=Astathelohania contejeani TaxID=164912 RepID=A0ABQ7HVN8_9MICR|nr:tRNA (guanine(37)-N1)-methyltransferase [Thelohania contejeani]
MIEDFSELIKIYAVVINKTDIKTELVRLKPFLSSYPRLPPIIDCNKRYFNFNIETSGLNNKILICVDSSTLEESRTIFLRLNWNYFTYKEILSRLIPVDVPCSFETIGGILHLNLNDSQMEYKKIIGEVLLKKIPNVDVVITKVGTINNTFRFFECEVLAGTGSLEVIHKEVGLLYFINYEKVYWNSRLQNERSELVKLLRAGERVVDIFCGAGAFSIPALAKGCEVWCNDLNPEAIICLKKSLSLNKLEEKNIFIYNLDAKHFMEEIVKDYKWNKNKYTHYILNLPEYSLDYLKYLKDMSLDGMVHCYFFCKNSEDVEEYVYQKIGSRIGYVRVVRAVSPSKKMYKLNLSINELKNFLI